MNDVNSILITGGLGYIGSHIAIYLLKNGYEVTVLDRNSINKKYTLNILKKFNKFRYIEGDIIKQNFKSLFLFYDINTVIHCGGNKNLLESWQKPELYLNDNTKSLDHILDSITKQIKNIIFISTSMVYGKDKNTLSKENSILNPLNPYAKSKYIQEDLLEQKYNQLNQPLNCAILRCFNPIGCFNEDGLFEDINKSKTITSAIINTLKSDNPEFNIYGNNFNTFDGTPVRDYFHIADLTNFISSYFSHVCKKENSFDIWNIGSGEGVSVEKLLMIFEKITNKRIKRNYLKERPGEVEYLVADTTKSLKELKWSTKYSTEQACLSIIKAHNLI